MDRIGWAKSVVTRLVGCFCLGGVLLSIGIGILEYQRSLDSARIGAAQEMAMVAQNLRHLLRTVDRDGSEASVRTVLRAFSQDPRIRAARLVYGKGPAITAGHWDTGLEPTTWTLHAPGASRQPRLNVDRPTRIDVPFLEGDRSRTLQLLVDGPHIRRQMRAQALGQLSWVWITLGVLTLLGLLVLRRWLVAPLRRLVSLSRRGAGPDRFERMAERRGDEFGQLAGAIGRMLRRLNQATARLRQRELAYQHLYELAPTAMLSVDEAGRITHANRRAAELFGRSSAQAMLGSEAVRFIRAEDRGRFRQFFNRLQLHPHRRCELRLELDDGAHDADVEFQAVHDERERVCGARVSFFDVSESRQLMRQVMEQRRLLDLVVNHMSDAILLVGADGRIITANAQVGRMRHEPHRRLAGRTFDPAEFWMPLEPLDPEALRARLATVTGGLDRPIQERFEARDGSFLFQIIPVEDDARGGAKQLWVVQEASEQARSQRLLAQQSAQLHALQRLGRRLRSTDRIEELMRSALEELSETFRTEAIGIALRGDREPPRNRQLIWQGGDRTALETGRDLAGAVRSQLMPRVLAERETTLWRDLSQHAHWTGPFTAVGIESLAAIALSHRDRDDGILWIGRRGDRRIERQELFLLEALAPLLAGAVENTRLRQRLRDTRQTDPITDLPTRRRLRALMAELASRPGRPWALLALDLDHFKQLNDRLADQDADALLNRAAAALRNACRPSDHIIRYEGNTFTIVCPEIEVPEARRLAERLRSAIAALDFAAEAGSTATLTCSVGIAASPADGPHGEPTLELALRRLRAAKANGRDRVEPQQVRAKTDSPPGPPEAAAGSAE